MASCRTFNSISESASRSIERGIDLDGWKGACLDALSDIKKVAERMGGNSLASAINSIIVDLRDERFYLAVLGSFKRGKSTLINALLGLEVLPTGILPLTSVITRISFGKETQARVFFEDGNSIEISASELESFTTEKGNPNNEKGVTEVQVYVNNELLRQGVVLVDTPGIGSVHVQSTQNTYRFLPKIDAAIFVTGVDPPISNEEINFLSEMCQTVNKVFIVLNKMDLVDERDIPQAIAYTRSVIANFLNTNSLELYPLSSKLALLSFRDRDKLKLSNSGFIEFSNRLKEFLLNERGRVFVQSAIKKGIRNASDLLTLIDLQLKMLQQPINEIQEKMTWLKKEIERVNNRISELDHVIAARCEQAVKKAEAMISSHINEIVPRLLDRISNYVNSEFLKCKKKDLVPRIEKFITESVEQEVRPILNRLELDLQKAIQDITFSLERELEKIHTDFREEVGRIFQVQMPSYQESDFSICKSRVYFDEVRLFDYEGIIPLEIPYVLPKPLYIRVLLKRVSNVVTSEMDKYSGKLRYDYAYRLNEGIRLVKSEIIARMQITLDIMRKAVESIEIMKEKAQFEKNSKFKELAELRASVKEAIDRLNSMSVEIGAGE